MITSPDDLDLFNLSTVFEVFDVQGNLAISKLLVFFLIEIMMFSDTGDVMMSPPPKNIGQLIMEYVDRKNKDPFFTTNLI